MRTRRNAHAHTVHSSRPQAGLAAILTAAGLALAACGSATVEDEAPETLSKTSTETSTTKSSGSSTVSSSKDKDDKDAKDTKSSTAAAQPGSNAEPAPQGSAGGGATDRGAQEIQEIPEASGFEGENAAFLDAVRELGVDVDGVEGQIVSAGHLVCNDQTAILYAVAGQLIGQDRTDREFEDLADTLTESARENLC